MKKQDYPTNLTNSILGMTVLSSDIHALEGKMFSILYNILLNSHFLVQVYTLQCNRVHLGDDV